MKTIHIPSFPLVALAGLIIYQSFLTQRAVQKGQHFTQKLSAQIDSLQSISEAYQRLHQDYAGIYQQLILSRLHVSQLRAQVDGISTAQQADVRQIREGLQEILSPMDTIQFKPLSVMPHDEILFQP
ncbi:hypothetical protein N6H18_14210 [Reichenbachiella agarivorans]|uniref:LemA protein n=1 Tax=Reichenbachiella agarivorans TaxID=2979464 RepID=A0ABY6CLX5_9BACT|nr:hypothetical protein [Reichenbachiella agarivorans]UXP31502.1 hypothetical protein N6H18_14210 [Reichenbachiella agarivorans]